MKVNDNQVLPYTFILSRSKLPAEGTGQKTLSESGKHPRCRLIRAQATALVYANSVDIFAIEHEDGGNVATASASATIGTPVNFAIAPAGGYSAIFERNEPIICIASTEGDVANATRITATFESLET